MKRSKGPAEAEGRMSGPAKGRPAPLKGADKNPSIRQAAMRSIGNLVQSVREMSRAVTSKMLFVITF